MRLPRRPTGLGVASAVIVILLYAPLAIAVLYAFNDRRRLTWPPSGLSLMWFREIFGDELFRSALGTSFLAGAITAVVAGAIGTAAAVVFTRRRSRVSRSTELASRLPVMLPPLFIGVGIAAAMQIGNVRPSIWTIVAGHSLIALPFVVIVISARLETFDVAVEQAARDLGAGPAQALRRITFPIVAPAILGAMLLAFAVSFDETLVTNFTSGTSSTVPIYVYGRLRRYIDPGANAVATILLLIPWVALAVAALVLRRSGTTTTARAS